MIKSKSDLTAIGQERGIDFCKEWFDLTKCKILHNVDTVSFGCYPKHNYNTLMDLGDYLSALRSTSESTGEELFIPEHNWFMQPFGISFYNYVLVSNNRYRIFFAKKQSRLSDVPILCFVASEFLWQYGEIQATNILIHELNEFLHRFGSEVGEIKLSRIDYAFHTNYIQDMGAFFGKPDKNIVSQFKTHQFIYRDLPDMPSELATFYYGNRGGKTVYFRAYDKTRETVEAGYKQFFYMIWQQKGLINKFDQYVLEKTFIDRNFERHHLARLSFYLEYGINEEYKEKCRFYLNPASHFEFVDLVNLADLLTPPLTRIVNLEYQVGSKFHKSSRDFFVSLKAIKGIVPEQQTFYKMLHYKAYIVDYLTSTTLRMVKSDGSKLKRKRDYSYFWTRLRACDLRVQTFDGKLIRSYQKNCDIALLQKQLARKIATVSILSKGENNDDFEVDVSDVITSLPENVLHDVENYKFVKCKELRNRLS